MAKHAPLYVIGYASTVAIIRDIFKRCESPDTAVPAILVSGANGTGKTFLLEACAQESGRVVIELANLRGMYFGQTDGFFEKLVTFAKELNEEDQRGVAEQLSEEELALFDILTKPKNSDPSST